MVSAFASSWPSPPELDTPRKKEESLKALKALVRDWDLLEKKDKEEGRGRLQGNGCRRAKCAPTYLHWILKFKCEWKISLLLEERMGLLLGAWLVFHRTRGLRLGRGCFG